MKVKNKSKNSRQRNVTDSAERTASNPSRNFKASPNPYFNFLHEIRGQNSKVNCKLASRKWKEMSTHEKNKYKAGVYKYVQQTEDEDVYKCNISTSDQQLEVETSEIWILPSEETNKSKGEISQDDQQMQIKISEQWKLMSTEEKTKNKCKVSKNDQKMEIKAKNEGEIPKNNQQKEANRKIIGIESDEEEYWREFNIGVEKTYNYMLEHKADIDANIAAMLKQTAEIKRMKENLVHLCLIQKKLNQQALDKC